MKTILSRVSLSGRALLGLTLLVLLSAVGEMMLPSLLAQMINRGVSNSANSMIMTLAFIMAAITVFACIINFFSVKISSRISNRFAADLRAEVFAQVQGFSAAELDRFGAASLVTRSTSDITIVQNFLTLLLRVGILAPMMAVAGLVFSAATGGEVSSVLSLAIPVLLIVLGIIVIFASKYSIRLRKKLDHLNQLFLESLEGVRVIRAFNKEGTESARFNDANADYAATAMTAGRIGSFLMPAINVIFGVTTAAVLGRLNGYIEEMINGQTVVQAFGYGDRVRADFDVLNDELRDSAYKADVTAGAVSPITRLVNDSGYVLCAAIGCLWAIAERITVGNVQAMLEYTRRFAEPFSSIAEMAGSFGAATAAGSRIFALLDAEEEVPDSADCIVPSDRSGSVTFENVRFGYTPDRLLMKDVNITVQPGQKVAIVGPTGAGKTTLINLLMRFYEVDGGRITVDGVDTKKISRAELHDRFGMVLQDTWLFEGSIRDNIGYAEDNMPKNKIITAAQSACAHNFIKALLGSYDMVLSKGAENISQGERQLLTIARAIALDPEIMILDEATSNVDTHTEVLIQKAMAELMKGRTSFVIAHRLSTILDADMILYMEDGDIKEVGTHNELMALGGKYNALYNSQFA